MFFLSFRQNTSIVYIDICRINECNQNMLTFIKYTYGTTCFNYTYLLIFILSMITSKHKMRHKSFVQCSRYYTALYSHQLQGKTHSSQQHHGLITGTLPYCWNSLQSEYYHFDSVNQYVLTVESYASLG